MKPIKQVILGLANTSTLTIPIERVYLLELGGIDALSVPLPSFSEKSPSLKINFIPLVKDYSYYSPDTAEDDLRYIWGITRYNLVDITLVYADESKLLISLPWEDDDFDFHNRLEKLTRFPNGHTLIEI